MPDQLGQIGQFFSSDSGAGLLKGAEAGLGGAGLIGNILNEKQRSDQISALTKQEKNLPDATTLAKQVAAATQPLNMGLVQGVENQVSGSLASQGLSQAPGIQAAVLAQALAPAEQQNQNTALQVVMQRLGLPIQYASAILSGLPKDTNLAPLLALLQKGNTPSTGSSGNMPSLQTLLNLGQQPSSTPGIAASPSGDSGWLGATPDPPPLDLNLDSSGIWA